jgi:hypothetical protein
MNKYIQTDIFSEGTETKTHQHQSIIYNIMSTMSTDSGLTAETFHKGTLEKRQQFRPPQNSTKRQAQVSFFTQAEKTDNGEIIKRTAIIASYVSCVAVGSTKQENFVFP